MPQPLKKNTETTFQTVSPVDGRVYLERPLNGPADIEQTLELAIEAQKEWQSVPLETKQRILTAALEALLLKSEEIAEELSWQMGRPISQTPLELRGLAQRARVMIDMAPQALADIVPPEKEGFKRYIRRVPLGVVAIVAPWNYPYLTSVNGIFPALLAGNAVILKSSHQTPLCADRYAEAFETAGLLEGVFQFLDLDHENTELLVADPRVDFVNFTGSVKGGHAIQKVISNKFISAGLELGGKDPAYVRADADLDKTLESLVDGAFFNSGQSCCGIERIYVHEGLYDRFVDGVVEKTYLYCLGNPLDPETNLGPMIRNDAADFVREQVAEAVQQGAKSLIDESRFPESKPGTPYLAPQVLVNVNHNMRVMTEENFGPVVGIMKVSSDEEALTLMNDSDYGLTASFWTKDTDKAEELAQNAQAGTVFVNRCDYLDPTLAWTGIKNSGRGCTLSLVGFECLTRPKSFHIRQNL